MLAIVHTQYGPPDELQLKEIPMPVPKDDEVLVKIHATTVTTSDCNIRNLTFVPKLYRLPARLELGYNKPKINILGIDLAGEIEAIGASVSRFKQGDRVFGTTEPDWGAHAQYICLPQDSVLTTVPDGVSWQEVATIPNMGNTALFYLRDLGNVQPGQQVLINGASGGIGTFAVQLAKHFGAEVTAVSSTKNLDLARSLGADKVIDYTKEDFTENQQAYDVIFDTVGKNSFSRCKKALRPGGIFLENSHELRDYLHIFWTSLIGDKKVKGGMSVPTVENMNFLMELLVAGRLKPVIDRTYPLEQTAEAFRYVEQGHKKGNVVITVAHSQ